ncbi:hypothetical protein LCGC14_1538860 [marine sediment metagenome]|uniref:Gene product 88 domain-containing protein n=1 Tax=marine sediment metagenome TaxID=412755 RepID=A0A0F9ITR1_9ZZZZ
MNTYTKNVVKIMTNTKVPEHFTASTPAKISSKSNNSFSMLAGPKFGCPGATKACVDCYAMKGSHHMPNVQKALSKNWLLMKKLNKNYDIEKATQELISIIPKSAKIFRIHESSDFFSQWYVDVWANVVKSRKDVSFWAYTRSFNLNFTNLTRNPNFALWASTDKFNAQEAKQFVRRFRKSGVKHAYGPWEHETELPTNSFVCPATTGQIEMLGACEKCSLCIVKKRINKNIVFLKH